MRRKGLTLILPVLVLLAVSAMAAVTGRITGTVTDTQTKEPLIGVSVQIVGTTIGAITNAEGSYTILNVPVGTYQMRYSIVGYAEVLVDNVEVSADLATYESHELSSQVTDIGKTIEVRSERPLVAKDKTTTINITRRDELLAMPTRGFEQVVGLQNSVVRMKQNVDNRQRGQREATGAGQVELNLRGGRPSEVAYYVDGFSQQDPLSGISTAAINNNAIKEVSVQSGTFSAEYGYVSSGIVNVVTNSGGEKYAGNIEVATDNLVGRNNSYDQNFYTADFSGPIPGLKKAFFFLSGERRWLGDREPSSMTEEVFSQYDVNRNVYVESTFVNPAIGTYDSGPDSGIAYLFGTDTTVSQIYGDDFLNHRLPNNSQSGWSYQGKIDYNLNSTMKLGLSMNGSVDNWQQYRHNWVFSPWHSPEYNDRNFGANLRWTHTLSNEAFYNLSMSYFSTYRFRGDGELGDNLGLYTARPYSDPEETGDNLYLENAGWSYTLDTIRDEGGAITGIDTTIYYNQKGLWPNYLKRKSSYIGSKGDLNFKLDDHNSLRTGFDFQYHTLRYYENLETYRGYQTQAVNRYGYDEDAEESDNEGFRNDTKHPYNLGMYLEDRLDWQGLIVNAGLRFDFFDYRADRIKDILSPMGADQDSIDASDLEPSEKFTRVSPRIGIGFPVSDRTQMHINYGKFFQRPDLARLYVGYDFFAERVKAGSFYPFASPNLEPEKTTQYEVGITHQLGENTALEVTAYYKDVQGLTQIFHVTDVHPKTYDIFANTDYGTVKGVDFSINMRRSRNIALDLRYSLSYASGTGSYAQSQYIIAWQNPQGTPKMTSPLDYDQRHSIVGILDLRAGKGEGPRIGNTYILQNAGLNIIAQAGSGTPYTPIAIGDEITEAAFNPNPIGQINSANLPWQFTIDLKAQKSFYMGNYKLSPYIQVRNLLDRDNVVAVYEGTGEPDETGYLGTPEGQGRFGDPVGTYRYGLKEDNPKNWGNPRQFLFGLTMSF